MLSRSTRHDCRTASERYARAKLDLPLRARRRDHAETGRTECRRRQAQIRVIERIENSPRSCSRARSLMWKSRNMEIEHLPGESA